MYSATKISEVFLFEPKVFIDDRGFFFESFKPEQLERQTGYRFTVAQVNNSISEAGVLRGLHFKQSPPGQAKFVSVIRGAIIDAVVDLRTDSPTYLQWQTFELNANNRNSLFIGNGIGHAFLSLEDNTTVSYLCDTPFEPELEHSINPLTVGIDWQQFLPDLSMNLNLSDKDLRAARLEEWSSSSRKNVSCPPRPQKS